MGAKLSKKGFNVAYEKPTAQRVEEEPNEAATVMPEESEEAHPAAESMEAMNEKRDQDTYVSAGDIDKEGGRVPAVHPEEACKPESRQLDVVPNEEQLVAIASEETTTSSEAGPAQLLEVSAPKGVESRQEGDAE